MHEQVLTVTLLTQAIQELLESEFPLVYVVGEVSNYKRHQSGHRYFTLKDEGAQIRCVLWRGRPVEIELQDGMQVHVRGRLSLYPLQGYYQIDCFTVLPAGIGDLYAAFEQLKRELAVAGYFDASRKRSLPRLPERVGIATSPTGAALQDILSTLERRNPAIIVVFRPTLVQGANAAQDIAEAIAELERWDCDVIIVGRGGGSLEDLWAFNTRTVADAIFRSTVPIVSAVGHETDFTIADFVADVRAATPTAAAELCSPLRIEDILYFLDSWQDNTSLHIKDLLDSIAATVHDFTSPSIVRLLVDRAEHLLHHLSSIVWQCTSVVERRLEQISQRIDQSHTFISLLHPLEPLHRGFAVIERNGTFLHASELLAAEDTVWIHRMNDIAQARITQTRSATYSVPYHAKEIIEH